MEPRDARLWIALFCVALAAPHWNRVTGLIPERSLHGAVERVKAATLSLEAFRSGEFQRTTEARFNQRLSLRGFLVLVDSSLSYHLTGQTPKGAGVIVGEEDVLFPAEDLAFFNSPEPVPQAQLSALAHLVSETQRLMALRGKVLVLVVVPSKSSIWPDAIPAAWRRDLPEPRPCDVTYRRFVEALVAEHALFVDGRALLADARFEGGERAFPRDGRHWSERAACEVLREIGRVSGPGLPSPIPPVECELLAGVEGEDGSDHDLRSLMNVWAPGQPRSLAAPEAAEAKVPPPGRPRGPTTLLVGTSFFWKLVPVARRGGLFEETDLYYYNSKHHRFQGELPVVPVVPHGAEWRERTLSRELVIVDAAEMFLPLAGSGFLEDLRDELAQEAAP